MDTLKSGPRLRLVGGEATVVGTRGASEYAPGIALTAPPRAAVHAAPTGSLPMRWWTRRLAEVDAIEEVRRENVAAAAMAPTDPRWVLALRVYESIEGGRAAVLRPEKRRNLMALATRLGLRPFDANLVIAIVQDAARAGEPRLGPDVTSRLSLVRGADRAAEPERGVSLRVFLGAMGAAAVLGYLILDALIGWVAR